MKESLISWGLSRTRLGAIFLLAASALHSSRAATLWTGPDVQWTKSAATPSDVILEGKVVLTRGSREVLYNTAAGETAAGASSPKDTEWAFGALADFATLSYKPLESFRDGDLAALILNKPMVVHIISEDIYFSITFTTWGQFGAGTVAYRRSTPAASSGTPPNVSMSSPASGAILAAPATLQLMATADVIRGTVTNVAFFNQAALLGSVQTAPFNLTVTNLAAGSYSLSAVATAAGISSTSAVVNITVIAPVDVKIASPTVALNQFQFTYTADPGLSYVVETSTDLLKWTSVLTNAASSNPVSFSQPFTSDAARFYRITRSTQ